ncbi:MAG: isocitrate lyase/PEP mutase family protein, partial [Deltaproteobacteria bacterium]|nr:isocitrate lyase/PEP mutase family protein [Deltaproteobacteria bacterium]
MSKQAQAVKQLRKLLNNPDIIIMPCCYDAFSARMIREAGFGLTFMSGFAVSAARLGLPDTGLISYAEMIDQGRSICDAVSIPVIGDGDTGYGNTANVKRTVHGYFQTGFAGIMIEDQRSPKRCGHTKGKEVVSREAALQRFRAAVEAREELRAMGDDIILMARTDARATHGLGEALERAGLFGELGADILFVEAPESEDEMRALCPEVPGCHLAN